VEREKRKRGAEKRKIAIKRVAERQTSDTYEGKEKVRRGERK
jgi:hypothetical protein